MDGWISRRQVLITFQQKTYKQWWGGGELHSEIHKLIMLIWNKEELHHHRNHTYSQKG
jgi:hypothetical protein